MTLENVFSWSKSRDEEFRECQRKYFYDKYASWGGWDKHSPEEARQAYILKNLKNRWAWKGESVHHTIETILKAARNNSPLSVTEALDLLTETMRMDYRSSKDKRYLNDPKKSTGLFEHEYEKGISDATWKKIHEESVQCLKSFLHSSLYQELSGEPKGDWLLIEDLEEFDFEGSKIFVKLDFARKKDGKIEIYDWKTGKNDNTDAGIQIGAYTLYAMQKWKIDHTDIRAYLFNLSQSAPTPDEQPVDEALLQKASQAMRESIVAMKKLLLDAKKNIPLPRENFTFTENTRLCDFCNFKKICEKYK